ncbi:MAG: ABC transporter ATP-binding protein [Candidatus Riflebacteria bacterium]|nr:ABC transporter ATP-binding protein [Candidatus Riflebacteria bacterium]
MSLIAPKVRTIDAVRDVTFQVEPGELLAFIGPNGAGKSTTIKMLTGILHPSCGEARVLGFVPWRQRRELAFHIGSVFGQRSQLWMHLPPQDSFRLLGRIYEVPDRDHHRRIAKMAELFDLGELLTTPVRKLSLGQRMRCEIAASLLHSPRVIFLDEPTIGLDVIAKQKIRDLILTANAEEGMTIFLTSHDAGDIEKLCKRVIIIDRGQLLMDASVQALKRSEHFTLRTIGVRMSRPVESFEMEGVEILKKKGPGMKLQVDGARVPVESVIRRLMEFGHLEDISVRMPSLEEIIARIYREKGLPGAPPEATADDGEEP